MSMCFVTTKPFVYLRGATRLVRDGVCRVSYAFFFFGGTAYINILVGQNTIVGLYGDFLGARVMCLYGELVRARVLVYNLACVRVHAVL